MSKKIKIYAIKEEVYPVLLKEIENIMKESDGLFLKKSAALYSFFSSMEPVELTIHEKEEKPAPKKRGRKKKSS